MGIPSLSVGYGVRLAGPLRAVRVGERFLCGICRKRFASEGEAWLCVDSCWEKLLALEPVVVGRRDLKQRFFCRFCAREFMARAAAEKCARECLNALSAKRSRERELNFFEPETLPPKSPVQGTPIVPAIVPKLTWPVIEKPINKVKTTEKSDVPVEPLPETAVLEPTTLRKTPKDVPDDEKFFRDAAKYACKECSTRFFTRMEVIRCYDSHE